MTEPHSPSLLPFNWLGGRPETVILGLVYGYVPYMILLAGLPVYAWWQKREARLHADFASRAPGRVRT